MFVYRVPRKTTKRLVFPVKRLSIATEDTHWPIHLKGHQTAALRGSSATDKIIDQIDRTWYWTKREIIKDFTFRWSCPNHRSGSIDLSPTQVEKAFIPFIQRREIDVDARIVGGDAINPNLYPIERPVDVMVLVQCQAKTLGESLALRIVPALYVSEDEFTIEYEDTVCIDGSLQTILTGSSEYDHQFRLMALTPCRVRLMIHVERLTDHSIHTQPYPLIIDFS